MQVIVPSRCYIVVAILLFLTPLFSQKDDFSSRSLAGSYGDDDCACCDEDPLHPDYNALVGFYNSTNGNLWTNTLANDKKWFECHPCQWYGVTCNSEERVTGLNLPNNQLQGTFNLSFDELTALERLNISGNQMTNLQPALQNNRVLKRIDFSDNVFSGQISNIFYSMQDLEFFDISGNDINGNFPSSLLDRPNLITLNAADNSMSGSITNQFGNLPSLKHIDLSGNNFTGTVSSTLQGLSMIDIADNELSGNFPAVIGSFGSLGYLDLRGNLLTGCFPASYSNFCQIQAKIYLDNNCNLGNPTYAEFCAGATCNDDVPLSAPSRSCYGQFINVSAPLGYDNYSWGLPCGSSSNSNVISSSCPGIYSVTVTSSKGCFLVGSIEVDEYVAPPQNISASFCEGGSVTVQGETFSTAGLYVRSRQTIEGCPYNLVIEVRETTRPRRSLGLAICDGESAFLHGMEYSVAGTFSQSVNNPSGCDSLLTVNVSILENFSSSVNLTTCPDTEVEHDGVMYDIDSHSRTYDAVNGCDSVVYITVSALETFSSNVSLAACTGNQVIHDGATYGIGDWVRTYEASNGCDSTVYISVQELLPSYPIENYSICNGQTVEVNNIEYTGGEYEQEYINSNGCPSILYINVEETPPYDVFDEMLMCDGNPVTYQFQHTFNGGGDFTIPYVDGDGCNYNVQLHIEEAVSTVEDVTLVSCDGVPPTYKGKTYPNSISVNSNLTNAAGCDSTLIVRVTDASSSEHTLKIGPLCLPAFATVNDITYGYTNVFEQHFTNAAGCDSTLFIDVTVNIDREEKIELEICPGQSITINDFTYDSPGGYAQFMDTEGGCDSTLRIKITETDLITSFNSVLLCGDETYSENGMTYSASGTDALMFQTADGCDSLYTLTIEKYEHTAETIYDRLCTGDILTYNGVDISSGGPYQQTLENANGCDSILRIEVTEYSPSSSYVQRETCSGTPWVENGTSYNETGIYEQRISNAVSCDSTITIDLIVYENTEETLALQVCRDQTREVNGVPYNVGGTFIQDLMNTEGCDSTLTIEVTIVDEIRAFYAEEICEGESTTINGEVFSSTRTNEQFFTSSIGCDSILTVSVILNQHTQGDINAEVCTGEYLEINDIKYYNGGQEVQNLRNVNGCDSTLVINITELSPSSSTNYYEMCEGDPIVVNEVPYGFGGLFEQHFTNAVGCDSTFFVSILEHPDTERTEFRYLCPGEEVVVNDISYSIPSVYQQDFTNSQGCDSTLYINVQYSAPKDTTIYDFICDEGSYEFMGQTLLSAGEYPFYTLTTRGCDSTIILNLGQLTGKDTTIHRSICSGEFYKFGSNKLYASNTYFDEIIIGGCKTPTTLVLDVVQPSEGFRAVHKCEGELLWVDGKYESEAGFYEEIITSEAGCDSILTTQLIYETHKETVIDTVICKGSTLFFSNWIYDQPGSYRITDKSEYGCDSIIKLNIELYDIIPDVFEYQVCEGEKIDFESVSYGVGDYSGEYFDGNCLQEYLLIVSETDLLVKNETVMICPGEEVEFYDLTFSHDGQFYIGAEIGECAFVEYLTVLENKEDGVLSQLFICEGSDLAIGNQEVSENGNYDFELCEGLSTYAVTFLNGDTIRMEKTMNPGQTIAIEGFTYSDAGDYEIQVGEAAGCPSTLQLKIIIEECGGERMISISKCTGEIFSFFDQVITAGGEYSYNKELSFGCDSIIFLAIEFSQVEDFTIEGSTIICPAEETTLRGPDGFMYRWNSGEKSQSITVAKGGIYSLVITDEVGCSNSEEIEVEKVVFPEDVDLIRIQPQSCDVGDGSITVEVSNPEYYQYSIDEGSTWQESPEFNNLWADTYAVLIADRSLSCFTTFALPITLENKGIPKVSKIDIENVNSCKGELGSIKVVSDTDEMLEYSIDGGLTWKAQNKFDSLEVGKYKILVSPSGSSCVNDFLDSIEIIDKGILEINTWVVKEVSCESENDASISVEVLQGQPPYQLRWSTGENSSAVEDLAQGIYSVTVEDANGCVVEQSVEIKDASFEQALWDFRDTTLCENDTFNISGLDTSYRYYLFNGDSFVAEGLEFMIIETGHYQIIADRGEDCFIDKDFIVEKPDAEAFGIDFLLSSDGVVDEEIVLINVSDPMPEIFDWQYDTATVIMEKVDSFAHRLAFRDTGIYQIKYIASIENCEVSLTKEIQIYNDSLEIGNDTESNIDGVRLLGWNVSPNPNKGQFKVEVELSEPGRISLSLFDMFGARIFVVRPSGNASYSREFAFPNLSTGIYSVVLGHEGQFFQKSILIIK